MVLEKTSVHWFQKARTNAIDDNDHNTWYYHTNTIVHCKQNRIEDLKNLNGDWNWEKDGLEKMVTRYFKELYTDPGNTIHDLLKELLISPLNSNH